ncbi:hypothetical protein LSAT2_010114 [Lamellibrachia satsuma]|nr:hypothetical protein LSAT2_010114 [Lamellibrachia satsuma]
MKLLGVLCVVISLAGSGIGLTEDNFLVVADIGNKGLYLIDLSDGSSEAISLTAVTHPIAVAYNPVDTRVYWTDVKYDTIKRAYLNGTEEEGIALLHSGSIVGGIAVDFISGLVYYTDRASDSIAVMTLDGSQHFTLLTEDMDEPEYIALDIARG